MLGVRLAKLTSNPDLVISDGESLFLGRRAAAVREGRRGRGLDPVPPGLRRRRLRQAARDDGRHPGRPARQPEHLRHRRLRAAQAAAARRRAARPGNTVNNRTSYWVPKHSPRVFVEQVDIVSGVGPDAGQGRPARRPRASTTSTGSSPTSAVFDVSGAGRHAAAAQRPPGRHRRRGARGHRLRRSTSPRRRARRPASPTTEELILIREVLDPKGLRVQGGARRSDRRSCSAPRSPSWSASGTRSCRPAWAGSPARAWSAAPRTPAASASWPAPR